MRQRANLVKPRQWMAYIKKIRVRHTELELSRAASEGNYVIEDERKDQTGETNAWLASINKIGLATKRRVSSLSPASIVLGSLSRTSRCVANYRIEF